jgi:hypothetical protein
MKQNLTVWGTAGVISLVVSLVVSGLVGNQPAVDTQAVAREIVQLLQGEIPVGAASGITRYPNSGIQAQFFTTSQQGTSTIGATSVTQAGAVNGGVQSTLSQGTCADATTTLFTVQNPFGATATAFFVGKVSGFATSATLFSVGTSSQSMPFAPTGRVATSAQLIGYAPIMDNELPFFRSGIPNDEVGNFFSNATSVPGTTDRATSTSPTRVAVGPTDYIRGWVVNALEPGTTAPGVTGLANTFACSYGVGWEKF